MAEHSEYVQGPSRRALFGAIGIGAAGLALGAGGAMGAVALAGGAMPSGGGSGSGVVPFHGEHQAGIV
ncbi:MAG: hypothetical protein KDB25_10545, partial [Leucobacter sp.]|nr:hypothetical protein [Leucobacter sp.]